MVLWILLKDGTLIIEVSAFLKWIFNFLQTNDEEGRFLQYVSESPEGKPVKNPITQNRINSQDSLHFLTVHQDPQHPHLGAGAGGVSAGHAPHTIQSDIFIRIHTHCYIPWSL